MRKKALYFVPVKKEYLSRWEYYEVDLDILKDLYEEVIICSTVLDVIKNYKEANIVFCWWWHRSAHIVLLSKLLGLKISITGAIHMFDISGEEDFYSKGILYRLSARIALALSDQNFFISKDQYHQITSHLRVSEPMVVLSSLTKNDQFDKISIIEKRKKLIERNESNNTYNFLSVAWHRLDQYKRKGIFETLSAMKVLKDTIDSSFQWTIIGGSGDGLSHLESRIREMNLESNVKIIIDATPEQKREAYLASDLYIQPSWCEGFGNAVMEAMSFGLPAVVSRYTAQPEVVGESGYVLLEIEPEEISRCLNQYISLTYEEKLDLNKKVLDRIEEKFLFERRLSSFEQAISLIDPL